MLCTHMRIAIIRIYFVLKLFCLRLKRVYQIKVLQSCSIQSTSNISFLVVLLFVKEVEQPHPSTNFQRLLFLSTIRWILHEVNKCIQIITTVTVEYNNDK